LERRRDDVLGQTVQPVRQRAAPGWPAGSEEFVAPPTQQEGVGAQRLIERHLGRLFATLAADATDPAAVGAPFDSRRVLDHTVQRDVLTHHDLSHRGHLHIATGIGLQYHAPRPHRPDINRTLIYGTMTAHPRPTSTAPVRDRSPRRGPEDAGGDNRDTARASAGSDDSMTAACGAESRADSSRPSRCFWWPVASRTHPGRSDRPAGSP